MIKLVIFDLDGVLVDTPDMHFETFAQAYYDFTNISITKKEHDLDFIRQKKISGTKNKIIHSTLSEKKYAWMKLRLSF